MGIRGVTSRTGLDGDLLQKFPRVYKHIEPNEHEVSQQVW